MAARRTAKSRPTVVTLFGTRPQFIKLAVLWRELEVRFRSVLIDSGQHYDWEMAGVFHDDTGLRPPDFHLGIGSASAGAQIGRIADRLDSRLAKLDPDAVVVLGDTSTTVGGAIAAAYRNIPLAHVEAGLRSFDTSAPEEKNRVIADHLATWRFCPTRTAMAHLKGEGIRDGLVGTGDLMYQHWLESSSRRRAVQGSLPNGVIVGEYYYVTAHRAENVDSSAGLKRLLGILRSLDGPVVYPVHPRTRKNLIKFAEWQSLRRRSSVHLLPPVAYSESLSLIQSARAVLTDSGGVQREAYWSRVPCLILREVTEWRELLQCGAGILVGLNRKHVQSALSRRWRLRNVPDQIFLNSRPARAIATRMADDLC